MDLQKVQEAIADLKAMLREGGSPEEAIAAVCAESDVSEELVRHWFAKGEGKTPEEYAKIRFQDVSLDTTIAAAASRWMRDRSEPGFFGRRFYLDYDAWKGRKAGRRYYRYLGYIAGYYVEAIDEETHEVIKFNGGPEIWAEIRKKVAAADPYEKAHELRFAFDDPELTARRSILLSIRLALLGGVARSNLDEAADAVDQRIEDAESLTALYESLSPELKAEVNQSVEKPIVDAHWKEDGKKKSLSDLPIAQLAKIKRGEIVANPVHEVPRSWRDSR